jgi:ATP-binding cassette subfamily B protein
MQTKQPFSAMILFSLKLCLNAGIKSAVWQIFVSLLKGIEPVVTIYIIAKFISSVAELIQNKNTEVSDAVQWLLFAALVTLLMRAVDAVSALVSLRYRENLQSSIERQLIEKIYSLNQEQFDRTDFNIILSKAIKSKDSINDIFDKTILLLCSSVTFFISLVSIAVHSPLVSAIIVVTVVPSLVFEIYNNKRFDKVETENDKDWRIMSRTGWLLLDPSRMPEIRILGAYKKLFDVWLNRKNLIFSREIKIQVLAQKYAIIGNVIRTIGDILSNIWLLKLVVFGSFGLDNFLFLRGLLIEASSNIGTLVSNIQGIHQNYIEIRNLCTVLFQKSSVSDGKIQIKSSSINVFFDNVSFKYPGEEAFAIKNLTFHINCGEKVAIVGDNGSGKSTVMKLLLRQYLPSAGKIYINGCDIRDLKLDSYYEKMSVIMQDSNIFEHLTVDENIRFGVSRDVDRSKVISAAKQSGAHNFIEKLKYGYDHRLMNTFDDGTQLSGGESQRISLARFFARTSSFIVVDEPTSAVDVEGEEQIFSHIFSSDKDKTAIVISHRFNTVRRADKIMVLKKGILVETGNHESLMKNGCIYRKMFLMQAAGYIE